MTNVALFNGFTNLSQTDHIKMRKKNKKKTETKSGCDEHVLSDTLTTDKYGTCRFKSLKIKFSIEHHFKTRKKLKKKKKRKADVMSMSFPTHQQPTNMAHVG